MKSIEAWMRENDYAEVRIGLFNIYVVVDDGSAFKISKRWLYKQLRQEG